MQRGAGFGMPVVIMASRVSLLFLMTLPTAACGAPPSAPVVSEAPPSPVSREPAPPTALTSAPSARLPPEIPSVASPACALAGTTSRPIPLRLARGESASFATIEHATVHVAFPPDYEAPPLVDAKLGRMMIRGFVEVSKLYVFLKHPTVIAGFAVPFSMKNVDALQPLPGGRFEFQIERPHFIRLLGGIELSAQTPCDALSIEDTDYDAESAAPRSTRERDAVLIAGRKVPLSMDPTGEPIAEIDTDTEVIVEARVIETRGKSSWIRFSFAEESLFGWVPSRHVRLLPPRPQEPADEFAMIGLLSRHSSDIDGKSAPKAAISRCSADVPLIAEQDGKTVRVGTAWCGSLLRRARGARRNDRHHAARAWPKTASRRAARDSRHCGVRLR